VYSTSSSTDWWQWYGTKAQEAEIQIKYSAVRSVRQRRLSETPVLLSVDNEQRPAMCYYIISLRYVAVAASRPMTFTRPWPHLRICLIRKDAESRLVPDRRSFPLNCVKAQVNKTPEKRRPFRYITLLYFARSLGLWFVVPLDQKGLFIMPGSRLELALQRF